ncbi:FAD-binding and (Fe-S)-binding domain-containing protein [Ruania halotolerans]|uniref:FAD-binding and (Fe-S)-binding domain-containing protein n=1 Tax=Ruania halotolerans TaxID=2897773 RepID=UPI001E46EFC0|nr:FAD-binding and (Fe-S)-binding domain-containing protein [Ruania halotolerans]UFU06819.1 FAD-binding oxidoreductase [Ruania halotolerans]
MPATAAPLDQVRDAVAPGAWSTATADLAGMAHDASHYLLRPRAIATPATFPELVAALTAAHRAGQPVTFRAGGTSLSGQAGTDGVLIDVRRHFDEVEVLDGGARVRCAPGAVLRRVNAMLARYGRKLGPDPASEIACTVGGVVANNSSGMTSGIAATAYHTLDSIRFVLPTGTVVDTAEADADARLRAAEPDLHDGLLRLREQIRSTPALRAVIEHQFSMKNTMGYALNAFLDHDDPAQILAHLMVGSEGTLGYIASVVLRTVPVPTEHATALLVLDSAGAATDALPELLGAGARAAELMDAAALRVAQRLPAAPAQMKDLQVSGHAGLLIEFQTTDAGELADQVAAARPVLKRLGVAAEFTSEASARSAMWVVRKGLYAAVAGARRPGTTNLLEDIAVPPPALTDTVHGLAGLFDQYGYDDAVIFGHARDANLHFMITPNLDDAGELAGYEAFTEDMVDLVLGADGTLKAEHGTGRIMSAYVRRQFGDELYAVMGEVKRLCDPRGILAPGVLLDDDPRAHVRNLKVVPTVNGAVDRCVDCGFCEPACPSRNTTTTPRRRIALLREAELAGASGDTATQSQIESAYSYDAVQTCAADSLCARACPVDIDTGAVMKSFRAAEHGPFAQRAGGAVAGAWSPVSAGLRTGLRIADAVPSPVLSGLTSALRGVLPHELVPAVGADLPGAGSRRSDLPAREARQGTESEQAHGDAVFFPSCTGAMFGPASGGEGASAAFLEVCERAGLDVMLADRIDELCCGTPWASKGFTDGQNAMAARVADSVIAATDGGRLPLVCDAASCTHGLADLAAHLDPVRATLWSEIEVLDAVTFVRREVLPRLDVPVQLDTLVLHPTCSTEHLGTGGDLQAVAGAVAREVTVPPSWGCCGFAGDRGMLHPELTAGATEAEAEEIGAIEAADGMFDSYASCNRTCEMGMSRATGREYEHVVEVLARLTRPV